MATSHGLGEGRLAKCDCRLDLKERVDGGWMGGAGGDRRVEGRGGVRNGGGRRGRGGWRGRRRAGGVRMERGGGGLMGAGGDCAAWEWDAGVVEIGCRVGPRGCVECCSRPEGWVEAGWGGRDWVEVGGRGT